MGLARRAGTMARPLRVAILAALHLTHALVPPAVPNRVLAEPLRRSATGNDGFESANQRGAYKNESPNQRGQDEDPYAFVADADLAASYSDRDSYAGAATLLVGVDLPGAALDFEASIAELADLATGAGLRIDGPPLSRRLRQPDPQTYTDANGIDHIKDAIHTLVKQGAEEVCVVFDDELTPDQQKNLEMRLQVASPDELRPRAKRVDKKKKAFEYQKRVFELRSERGELSQAAARSAIHKEDRLLRRRGEATVAVVAVRVLDRTAVVLDIFAKRATTRSGRLQVALALTLYQTPRQGGLFRGVDDDRDTGGSLGTNKQERRRTMDVDQKTMRDRASRLNRKITALATHRDLQRRRRARTGAPTVALVGYTNAGKSSLLAALVGGAVEALDADDEDNTFSVDDKVFATLDPLTRRVRVEDQVALVTDTVGFVSKLPAQVVAAFRATLEEVSSADVIVHVVDASAPRHVIRARSGVVDAELAALGCRDTPKVTFFNKVDLMADAASLRAKAAVARNVAVGSAAAGDLGALPSTLAGVLAESLLDVRVTLPYADASYGRVLDEVLSRGRVFEEMHGDEGTDLVAAVPWDLAGRLRPYKSK